MSEHAAREVAPARERLAPHAAPAVPRPHLARGLTPATVLALQRTAGNAAVSGLMRQHAATQPPATQEVRVVERMPTLPEPGVQYVIGRPEKRYTFEVELLGFPVHHRNLSPAQALVTLRGMWTILHADLDRGRAENLAMQRNRDDQTVTGFWADVRGRTYMPEPEMWGRVGRGTLYQALNLIDSTDAVLYERWGPKEAEDDHDSPWMKHSKEQWAAEGFDVTDERIKRAGELLEKAGRELAECQRKLDAYRGDTAAGAALMIRDVKITIVVLSATAGGAGAAFAPAGAGVVTQAAYGAATMGLLGGLEEAASQGGEMYFGLRDHFDVKALGKRVARDVITGFIGGVVGGKFSQVLKGRLGPWMRGLSEAEIAASGLTREQLLTNGERLFLEWVGGSLASSPFTTTASHLLDGALNGKLTVQTWGDFAHSVLDKLVEDGAMGLFLTYAGHAGAKHGRVEPAVTAEPQRTSTAHPKPPRRANPEYVRRPPGRRPSTGHPKPPKPPVIEESRAGGFEPTAKAPAPEDHGPAPHQQDVVLAEATPVRETRTDHDRGTRQRHTSVAEVEHGVHEALEQLHARAQQEQGLRPREIDALIAHIEQTDPAYAEQVRRYYEALENPQWVEEQMVHLWEQARDHGRTTAAELEHVLGGGKDGGNEFRNTEGLSELEHIEEFRKHALVDPRPLIDMPAAGDNHGAHTHAFQQYLGDRLFGPGEGLKFRQKLATLDGPTRTRRAGQEDEFEEPFYAQLWDELFDASGNMHTPEEIGPILQNQLDFPRWDPKAKP